MKVVYTERALESLDEAFHFLIYFQKIPPGKAEEIFGKVIDSITELSTFPYKGQKEELLDGAVAGHRRLVIGHYKIIYFIKNDTINITDIFDNRQAPDKMKP